VLIYNYETVHFVSLHFLVLKGILHVGVKECTASVIYNLWSSKNFKRRRHFIVKVNVWNEMCLLSVIKGISVAWRIFIYYN